MIWSLHERRHFWFQSEFYSIKHKRHLLLKVMGPVFRHKDDYKQQLLNSKVPPSDSPLGGGGRESRSPAPPEHLCLPVAHQDHPDPDQERAQLSPRNHNQDFFCMSSVLPSEGAGPLAQAAVAHLWLMESSAASWSWLLGSCVLTSLVRVVATFPESELWFLDSPQWS